MFRVTSQLSSANVLDDQQLSDARDGDPASLRLCGDRETAGLNRRSRMTHSLAPTPAHWALLMTRNVRDNGGLTSPKRHWCPLLTMPRAPPQGRTPIRGPQQHSPFSTNTQPQFSHLSIPTTRQLAQHSNTQPLSLSSLLSLSICPPRPRPPF